MTTQTTTIDIIEQAEAVAAKAASKESPEQYALRWLGNAQRALSYFPGSAKAQRFPHMVTQVEEDLAYAEMEIEAGNYRASTDITKRVCDMICTPRPQPKQQPQAHKVPTTSGPKAEQLQKKRAKAARDQELRNKMRGSSGGSSGKRR